MKKGYFYIAATALIFSTMEIALKQIAGEFHPLQLTFIRFFVGGLLLIPFAIRALKKRADAHIGKKDLLFFAFLGLLGMVVSMSLYQLAVQEAPASVVAVLFSSNPVFVTVLAFFLLREKIGKADILALAADIVGIFFIIDPLHTQLSNLGILLSLSSTLVFALYGVMGKRRCRKFGGIVVTCFSFLFGSLELLVLILVTNIPAVSCFFSEMGVGLFAAVPLFAGYTAENLPVLAFICIVNTGIGYACYFMAMETTSAHETSLVFFFKPILAPLFALAVLQEVIEINMIFGIVFILLGSLCSLVPEFLRERRQRIAGERQTET